VPPALSLAVVGGMLATSIGVSLLKERRAPPGPGVA